jgi:hypothetical protein
LELGVAEKDCSKGFGSKSKSDLRLWRRDLSVDFLSEEDEGGLDIESAIFDDDWGGNETSLT